jgi:hypothetical protein
MVPGSAGTSARASRPLGFGRIGIVRIGFESVWRTSASVERIDRLAVAFPASAMTSGV